MRTWAQACLASPWLMPSFQTEVMWSGVAADLPPNPPPIQTASKQNAATLAAIAATRSALLIYLSPPLKYPTREFRGVKASSAAQPAATAAPFNTTGDVASPA